MNGGPLPPVPDLIPIAALRGSPPCKDKVRHCAPCSTHGEVMGEQRSRRPGKQPAIDLIDSVQSRGPSAAPLAPSRKARSERHRKSDRRRDHRKRSSSDQQKTTKSSSPEHPRVNPIFVWVRQEDTHIVDVKCEDYDKRNRILLTKTAQGWRAIPRTETLVPSLKEAADDHHHHHHHHHHHRVRKSRKTSKVKRKSTAVQVDEDMEEEEEEMEAGSASPTWTTPVNIESHLPSHTIHVPKKMPLSPPESDISSVNSDVNNCISAQNQTVKCSASKLCDVSPLDNLLAVAELEFNNQIQTEEWNKSTELTEVSDPNQILKSYPDINDESKEYLDDIAHLNKLIDSCSSNNDNKNEDGTVGQHSEFEEQKMDECDYNDEDENNLSMDDILSRLEQSLQSPEACPEVNECNSSVDVKPVENEPILNQEDEDKNNYNADVPESNNYFDQTDPAPQEEVEEKEEEIPAYEEPETTADEVAVASSTIPETNEDAPTDLSISKNTDESFCDDMTPTDLSIPKNKAVTPLRPLTTPSPSQNSETIQSPQPSGIPAVPPSPDIFHNNGRNKSVFLESLLSSTSQKIALNSEVTLTRQKEPLDLGKCRKSASPTVTCSEEVKNNSYLNEMEPVTKKFKIEDITLKTLLDPELAKANADEGKAEQNNPPEIPKLLELLTAEPEIDPLTQLKQVLSDTTLNVPDPMLVPKDRLSQLLSSPGREIPRLLKQRPELRLPEALAYPHLLQDPDILVITLTQLETIIHKQCQPLPLKQLKTGEEKLAEKSMENKEILNKEVTKEAAISSSKSKPVEEERSKHRKEVQPRASINELANDIDAATNAAFNQMMWLPYLNQLEAAAVSFGNNPEFLKVLSNMFPSVYPGQVPDMSHLFNTGRIPPPVGFPVQPPLNYNPLEYSMWQEAMMQANLLRPKNAFESFNTKNNNYREYMEKMGLNGKKPNNTNQKMSPMGKSSPVSQNPFYLPPMHHPNAPLHNPFMNIPGSFPPTNSSQNLQVPQYNAMLQKNPSYQNRRASNNQFHTRHHQYSSTPKLPTAYHQQRSAANHHHHQRFEPTPSQKHKANSCKPYASANNYRQKSPSKEMPTRRPEDASRQASTQPIDLSGGSGGSGGKLKVKQHLIDQSSTPKLLKYDDASEVGSTTASIEEMQESQKHLWHPLFGK